MKTAALLKQGERQEEDDSAARKILELVAPPNPVPIEPRPMVERAALGGAPILGLHLDVGPRSVTMDRMDVQDEAAVIRPLLVYIWIDHVDADNRLRRLKNVVQQSDEQSAVPLGRE